jgi:hypothetical protein
MKPSWAATAVLFLLVLAIAGADAPVGTVKEVLSLQETQVSYPTNLAQVLSGSGPGRNVDRNDPVSRGEAVLTHEANTHIRLVKDQTEAFLFPNTEVRFDALNLWLMRRGATYVINKRGKLQVVVAGIEKVFVGSAVYLEMTDAGLLVYVTEGNVVLGATGEVLSLRPGDAGRVGPDGVRRRVPLTPEEKARIRRRIELGDQTISPGGGGGGKAALVLLGAGGVGAGVYLATRKPDLEVEMKAPQALCTFEANNRPSITIRNLGRKDAEPTMTQVRFPNGTSVMLPTGAIAAKGSLPLLIDLSGNNLGRCLSGRILDVRCPLEVTVDANGQVSESNEENNQVSGACPVSFIG